MSFTVRYECPGRLGNSIFPYILCIIYQLMGYKYVNSKQDDEFNITDDIFLEMFNESMFLNKSLPKINKNILITGYFQHFFMFKYYKEEIITFIKNNPDQDIYTALGSYTTYKSKILIDDYLPNIKLDKNDIIVHIRLGDVVVDYLQETSPLFVISPYDYDKLLATIQYNNIYWIVEKPRNYIEDRYIKYMLNKWGGIYEERTIEEDMCLMRKANTIICSRSTLSWISSMFSIVDQKVFMPVKYENWTHESFTNIHSNTLLYNYTKCNKCMLYDILK